MARHEKTSTHEEAGEGEGSCKGRPESGREDGQGLQADTHPGDRVGAVPLPALIAAVLLLAVLPGGAAAGDEPVPALRVVTFNLLHGGPSSGWRGDGEHLEERLAMVTRELGALAPHRSEEHTSELQSLAYLVCRLLLEKKKQQPCHAQDGHRRASARLAFHR